LSFCALTIVPAVLSLLAVLMSLLTCSVRADAVDKASKESFEFAGLKRNYALFAPPSAAASGAPLIVLLHGSFGSGAAIVSWWIPVAQEEGIVLVGPDARRREAWQLRADGPDFIRALIDEVAAKHSIDRNRIYLFGSSGGAVYSLTLSMVESQLFAATAVHAGAWRETNEFRAVSYARRKLPIAIFVGDRDEFFSAVRGAQDAEGAGAGGPSCECHGHSRTSSRLFRGRCRGEPQRVGVPEGQSFMNAKHWILTAALLAPAALQPARADDDLSKRIAACTREQDDARRLACFDRAAAPAAAADNTFGVHGSELARNRTADDRSRTLPRSVSLRRSPSSRSEPAASWWLRSTTARCGRRKKWARIFRWPSATRSRSWPARSARIG
jgi:predicted esterase